MRRDTLKDRVRAAADLIKNSSEQWIAWVGLNDEGRELHKLIPDSVLIEGQQTPDEKAAAIEAFQDGKHRVMITKPKIAGFGMNLQNAARMVFVGLSDSYESYYQCIRRAWHSARASGQGYIVLSSPEEAIFENVKRKEAEAEEMADNLISNVSEYEKGEIQGVEDTWEYETECAEGADYKIYLGDSVEKINNVKDETVDLSIFSPPFLSLYTYTPTERDIGNSKNEKEFFEHFGYIIDGLYATKPGGTAAFTWPSARYAGSRRLHRTENFRGKTVEVRAQGDLHGK